MVRVTGIDHLVVSVGDFEKSKAFYAPLMEFLDFGVEAEYEGMMGWANGKTLFWIAAADAEGKKHKYRKGDIGFHHYAFRLRSRADVYALQGYLEEPGGATIDPPGGVRATRACGCRSVPAWARAAAIARPAAHRHSRAWCNC